MELEKLLISGRKIRVCGFDDAHYADKTPGSPVNVAGIICSNTRFEGMVRGEIEKDGTDATEMMAKILLESKFMAQVQIVLLDDVTFGGCNVVNIRDLHQRLQVPVVAVMRKHPDLEKFRFVIERFPDSAERWQSIEDAGPIHELNEFVFQVVGLKPELTSRILKRLTDQGKVPEALRGAHLIGSAIKLGISGKRA